MSDNSLPGLFIRPPNKYPAWRWRGSATASRPWNRNLLHGRAAAGRSRTEPVMVWEPALGERHRLPKGAVSGRR